jgi:uncharacterized protein (DUF486 family)
MTWLPPAIRPIVLLVVSNVFMTFARYGHLKFTDRPLWLVAMASWGIAFVEYCFAVPANRWGSAMYSPAELKTMQEVITLSVFAGVLGALSRRAPHAQSRGGLRADLHRCLLRLQGSAVLIPPPSTGLTRHREFPQCDFEMPVLVSDTYRHCTS